MRLNKFSKNILFLSTAMLLGGCEYFRTRTPKEFMTNPFEPSSVEYAKLGASMRPAELRNPGAIIVCRSHQCAPAKLTMSREYVYNSLLHLFDNNNYQKALICQADPASHTCLENYITLPITAGITPTNAYIDHVKITDVIIGKQANKINLILNYNLTYGGQSPDCTPSQSILFAKNINHVLLEDAGYTCKMTAIGQTTVKTVFAIDYIDLDYGYIGGFYSIGLSGPAHGGGNGYMIMRLPKNAYPLAPSLQGRQKAAPTKTSAAGQAAGFTRNPTPSAGRKQSNNGVQIFPLSKTAAPAPESISEETPETSITETLQETINE